MPRKKMPPKIPPVMVGFHGEPEDLLRKRERRGMTVPELAAQAARMLRKRRRDLTVEDLVAAERKILS